MKLTDRRTDRHHNVEADMSLAVGVVVSGCDNTSMSSCEFARGSMTFVNYARGLHRRRRRTGAHMVHLGAAGTESGSHLN